MPVAWGPAIYAVSILPVSHNTLIAPDPYSIYSGILFSVSVLLSRSCIQVTLPRLGLLTGRYPCQLVRRDELSGANKSCGKTQVCDKTQPCAPPYIP